MYGERRRVLGDKENLPSFYDMRDSGGVCKSVGDRTGRKNQTLRLSMCGRAEEGKKIRPKIDDMCGV